MRILIDGVFFQLNSTGIARVWRSVIPLLQASGAVDVTVLDRGGCPQMPGVRHILPFPSYRFAFNAADSALLQRVCDERKIDVFMSTYFTTPLTTPSILLVHDMIPEKLGFDLTARAWKEKQVAILHARKFISVSHNTKKDLLSFYPDIRADDVLVAHNGIDHAIFKPQSSASIKSVAAKLGLTRPYIMLVGSRVQHRNYKNASLLFEALAKMERVDFDVLCVGGEEVVSLDALGPARARVRVHKVELEDEELAAAYGGAIALVYPSLYEGFGMPVVEAMASGCPVITTKHGSLAEVADGAAITITGSSISEMVEALGDVRKAEVRSGLVEHGLMRAKSFNWSSLATAVLQHAALVTEDADRAVSARFYEQWTKLRRMQAAVDTAVYAE